MAVAAAIVRRSIAYTFTRSARFMATSVPSASRNQSHRLERHEFSKPSDFLGSWKPPADPREAQKRLALLRRDYGKQVRELRKQYICEMEFERQEKLAQDEIKKEAILRAKEERKAAKSAIAQSRAAERKIFEEEFRQTLMKERQEKLELWRKREAAVEQKKDEKKELLRRQSSIWIDENDLEKKILEAIVDASPL